MKGSTLCLARVRTRIFMMWEDLLIKKSGITDCQISDFINLFEET